jgi:hypothetical protein
MQNGSSATPVETHRRKEKNQEEANGLKVTRIESVDSILIQREGEKGVNISNERQAPVHKAAY